jgi:hypothetical protein
MALLSAAALIELVRSTVRKISDLVFTKSYVNIHNARTSFLSSLFTRVII